ncbi:polyphosphate kinase 2 [Candidatus Gracilibacteria bacterium]|nr:polyphosphate kinase 2 [Candidatus Gracilibacteria bacterium]
MQVILEKNAQKFSEKELVKIKKIEKLFKKINVSIEKMESVIHKDEELVDIVKEIEKKYKPRKSLPEKKKDTHVLVAKKKESIEYEKELIQLQIELAKLQKHIIKTGKKLLVIFEGRDAAGKGGTIKRFMEHLNPRNARVVALQKPTDIERGQWYFERYVRHLPNEGEMVFFDRSWYNRAGVEPVMGFVGQKDYERFMQNVPTFEKFLVDSKTVIVKFYFSVSKEEQAARFEERRTNPLKQFKLSPIDQYSQKLWDRYSLAEYKNFTRTSSKHAPWTIIYSDDKKKARLNALKYLLSKFNYPDKIESDILKINEDIVDTAENYTKKLKKEIDEKKSLFE